MTDVRFRIVSFGCQMNKLDAEHLEGDFRRRGWRAVPSESDADVVVYLTCSVRRKPEEKVFSRLAQIPRRHGRPLRARAGTR